MAYQRYNESELFAFRQKDKRDLWKSIFHSLSILYAKVDVAKVENVLKETAKVLTQEICEAYPTEEAEKTPEYKEAELDKTIADTEKRLTQLKNIKSGRPF